MPLNKRLEQARQILSEVEFKQAYMGSWEVPTHKYILAANEGAYRVYLNRREINPLDATYIRSPYQLQGKSNIEIICADGWDNNPNYSRDMWEFLDYLFAKRGVTIKYDDSRDPKPQ